MQSGALIAMGVSSERRMPQLPDLPTLRELGYPDVVTTTWTMLTAPTGVPKNIVDAANREVQRISVKPELRKHFENEGEEPRLMSAAELTEFVKAEVDSLDAGRAGDGEEVAPAQPTSIRG